MADQTIKVDAAKIDARLARHEAEAVILDRIADELDHLADDKRREASRLRGQNIALLETARRHGYSGPSDSDPEEAGR